MRKRTKPSPDGMGASLFDPLFESQVRRLSYLLGRELLHIFSKHTPETLGAWEATMDTARQTRVRQGVRGQEAAVTRRAPRRSS